MDIKHELEKLALPPRSYIVVGSGLLNTLGIRQSADIDIVVTPEVLPLFTTANTSRPSALYDVATTWRGKTVAELLPDACYVDGIPYLSLDAIINYKTEFNREKDKRDLELIASYMSAPTYRHSAGGVVIHNQKVLTIDWAPRDYIALPKGTLEKGESRSAAAIREVKEETGYDVTIVRKLGTWMFHYCENDVTQTKEVDYYLLALANDNPPQPQREESERFVNKWLSPQEAMAKLTFSDAKEALRLAL